MARFNAFRRAALAWLALSFFLLPVAAQDAAGKPITADTKKAVLEKMGAIVKSNAFVPGLDFGKWDEFVDRNKEAIDKAAFEGDFADAINNDLEKYFGISHIVLITPRAAKARVERKVVGIGVQIQMEPEGVRIVSVFEDTPAKEAGLEAGDLIIEADGKKITSVTGMLGEEGTEVKIKVQRNSKTKEYKLKRRKYSNVRRDTITWLDPDTAHIKIHTFDLAYNRGNVETLMSEAFKAKNIILDLRSNGGGVVLNMLHLLGFFLPPDQKIGTFVTRSMVDQFVEETKGKPTELRAIVNWAEGSRGLRPSRSPIGIYKGNVAVLVNGGTGSASEITTMALKEYRDAPVVGTKTAGAVLVSVMAPLPEGWMLQYPMMDYLSAQGTRLEGTGVQPDVEAATPRYKEPDTAIEKAQALLSRTELREKRAAQSTPPPPEPAPVLDAA